VLRRDRDDLTRDLLPVVNAATEAANSGNLGTFRNLLTEVVGRIRAGGWTPDDYIRSMGITGHGPAAQVA
jgi:hypothetical protein